MDHIMAISVSPIMGIIWARLGVSYVFYLAALSCVLQLAAAWLVRKDEIGVRS